MVRPSQARAYTDASDEELDTTEEEHGEIPPSYEIAVNDASTTDGPSNETEKKSLMNEPATASQSAYAHSPASHLERLKIGRNSNPKRITSLAPSLTPGDKVLRVRLFGTAPKLRLALVTTTVLQVYDATRDSLLWELHGNSSQLVQGNEAPLEFQEGFRPSPDGSLLCAVVQTKDQVQRRLLILDVETGWIRTERPLGQKDGAKPHISYDNTKVAVCQWESSRGRTNCFRIMSLQEGEEHISPKRIPFAQLQTWQGMSWRIAPDNEHIISCMVPAVRPNGTDVDFSTCVYSMDTGAIVRRGSRPCNAKASASQRRAKPMVNFHFPSADDWLVSFPDFSSKAAAAGRTSTCIMNAKIGQTIAVVSTDLTLSQRWQAGMSASPSWDTQLAYDATSGIFTRLELSSTMLPRSQTATLTKFILSAARGRDKAVLRTTFQVRVMVVPCGDAHDCKLSSDGLYIFIQRASSGKIDIMSLNI